MSTVFKRSDYTMQETDKAGRLLRLGVARRCEQPTSMGRSAPARMALAARFML
jgi:hypothetical protein